MKRLCLILVTAVMLACTGCESEETSDYLEIFNFLDTEKKPTIFPDTMTEGGQVFYGNGKSENEHDLITQIEIAIWGEE